MKLELEVNESNEALIRTHHPDLGQIAFVYRAQELRGTIIWVVYPGKGMQTIPTHVAAREVHLAPISKAPTEISMYLRNVPDPIPEVINPRRFLLREDLELLWTLYPLSIGVRVYIAGWIVLLYQTEGDIGKDWMRGLGAEFGGIRVGYQVSEHLPSHVETRSGFAISDKPDNIESAAALGLKIEGSEIGVAITVPTHAFCNTTSTNDRKHLWTTQRLIGAKRYLTRLIPVNWSQWQLPAMGRIWAP